MRCDVAGAPVWSSTGFNDRGFLTPFLKCQFLVINSALHTLSIILCLFSLFHSFGLPSQLLSPHFLEFHPKTLNDLRPTCLSHIPSGRWILLQILIILLTIYVFTPYVGECVYHLTEDCVNRVFSM